MDISSIPSVSHRSQTSQKRHTARAGHRSGNGAFIGAIGGVVGTLVMDLVLMGGLSAVGLPALTCFSMVGDTVARFFSMLGVNVAGGVPFGVATHYVVGPIIGAIFGTAVTRVDALRIDIRKKAIVFAVLYVEVLSQPLLALTPILLETSTTTTLLWFGGSFLVHFLWGVVLGLIVSYAVLRR